MELQEALKKIPPGSIFITYSNHWVSKVISFWYLITHPRWAIKTGFKIRAAHAGIYLGGGDNIAIETVPCKIFGKLPWGKVAKTDFKKLLDKGNTVWVYHYTPMSVSQLQMIKGYAYGSCFSEDTKIPLLNGETKTIKELSEIKDLSNIWSYSIDKNQDIVPGKVSKVWRTGNKKVFKVTLDNNKFFKCTGEHLVMLRDGTYKRAEELKEKDSLMPLYRCLRKSNRYKKNSNYYECIRQPRTGERVFTHIRVVLSLMRDVIRGKKKWLTHHKDFNPLNNNPDNLKIMNNSKHIKLHFSKGTYSKHLMELHKSMIGKHLSKSTREKIGIGNTKPKVGKNCLQCGKYFEGVPWAMKDRKFCNDSCAKLYRSAYWSSRFKDPNSVYAKQRNKKGKACSKEMKKFLAGQLENCYSNPIIVQKMIQGRVLAMFKKGLNVKAETLQRYNISINHKVCRVEMCGVENVYDMEVEKYHNFALDCGVFVHNCGKLYDVPGFISFVIPAVKEVPGMVICTESTAEIIRYAGITIIPDTEAAKVHPTALKLWVEGDEGKKIGWKKVFTWDKGKIEA